MADDTSRLLTNGEEFRKKALAKNADLYTPEDEYKTGHPNSIADNDKKGRDPEEDGSTVIGTSIDIEKRKDALKKNAGLYYKGHEYNSGTA